jgi:hypothetical protein
MYLVHNEQTDLWLASALDSDDDDEEWEWKWTTKAEAMRFFVGRDAEVIAEGLTARLGQKVVVVEEARRQLD